MLDLDRSASFAAPLMQRIPSRANYKRYDLQQGRSSEAKSFLYTLDEGVDVIERALYGNISKAAEIIYWQHFNRCAPLPHKLAKTMAYTLHTA
jgi:hypothetical protein